MNVLMEDYVGLFSYSFDKQQSFVKSIIYYSGLSLKENYFYMPKKQFAALAV